MKRFFVKNRKLVEIFLTLGLIVLIAAYYYLIYIPGRENEIIARRFRTLQRIEKNMNEKFQGYQKTMANCVGRANKSFFRELVKEYNSDTDKLHITILDSNTISKKDQSLKEIIPLLISDVDSTTVEKTMLPSREGKKLGLRYEWYKLLKKDSVEHISINATIDYKLFVQPLLKKGVFDQYIVFNVDSNTSNTVYEDFPSGISFKGLDSLFDTKTKLYTSKIIKIKTAGESYLAFLHPCGYRYKNDRILVGLLKEENFDKERRQLPDSVVTTLLFIALFSILLLPIIRLAIMGKRERIRYVHLFATYISFLLLVPVVILVFISNNKKFLAENAAKNNSKKILADQISQSLNYEIKSAYNLLDKFDSLYCLDSAFTILDTININHLSDSARSHYFDKTPNSACIEWAVDSLRTYLKANPPGYQHTKNLSWIDSAGNEIANWAFDTDAPRGNYKERSYFQDVQNNNFISLEGDPGKNFAINPIISRTDGNFKVALSKNSLSLNKKLIAVSMSRFSSVINPVLPLGFDFSILDKDGNTIFDSDTTEDLNENLVNELVDSTPLKVALDTKTLSEFKTRHEDKDYDVLVEPISWLPYYIVILENQEFKSSLYTQSLSFTVVMMFSLFLFLCLEMLIILLAHHRSTKLQNNSFDFSWIYPRKTLSAKYFTLFLYNTSVLIVLIFFCFLPFSMKRFTEYIILFIIAILISRIVAFLFKANNETPEKSGEYEKKTKVITLFNQKLWIELLGENERKLKSKKLSILLLSTLAIIALINSFFYNVEDRILFFTSILIGLYLIFFRVWEKKRDNPKKASLNYMVNFRLMIFSRLLLISGFPVIIFFNSNYNFEQRLEQRLKLLDYAKNIEQHTKDGENIDSIVNQLNNKNSVRGFYTDGGWIRKVDTIHNLTNRKSYSMNDSDNINLLTASRLHNNAVLTDIENFELIRPFGSDSTQFAFNNILEDSVDNDKLQYRITNVSKDKNMDMAKQRFISLSSGPFKYTFPSLFFFTGGLVFWLLLFGALALCYLILIYATNKIFGIDVADIKGFNFFPAKLLTDKKVRYLFVQGTPNANKSSFIKDHLQAERLITSYSRKTPQNTNNTRFFYLNEIPDEKEMEDQKKEYENADADVPLEANWFYKKLKLEDPKNENVVFTHFEYKIFDEHTNRIKLNLIEKMIHLDKKKIIISSDIDPVEYFQSLKKFMNVTSGNTGKENGPKKESITLTKGIDANGSFFEYLNRWNNLLGRFTNIYISNESNSVKKVQPIYSPSEEFLQDECGNSLFSDIFKTQFKKVPVDEKNQEDYILKLQSLCDHSYRHIWASLTKEEQLTLYDLAEDGLVNKTNYISLTMLLNKRLVKKDADGVLMIINRSFRNFILLAVDSEEVKSIEKDISDGHTWNDYKYPLLIILGAVLYFVLSSNPEKFGNVLPVLSAVMAGIPTVLKLLSFLKPGVAKE